MANYSMTEINCPLHGQIKNWICTVCIGLKLFELNEFMHTKYWDMMELKYKFETIYDHGNGD